MKKSIWISIIVAVILIALVFAIRPTMTGKTVSEEYNFAQCLTDTGAVMYGTDWCGYCQSQKKDFGKSFKNINFVDCDANYEKCTLAGVRGYPTWIINGESYPGKQSLQTLSALTGCEL